jgi:lipoate-protein ligase B
MIARWRDLGRLPYDEALQIQLETVDSVQNGVPSTLLLVEHEPVLTLGAGFHRENLLLAESEYVERGISVRMTDRGGDITYHGPGQLVAYPIFDLNLLGKDLHLWLRNLEEAVIRAVAPLGLIGVRVPPHTGVWLGETDSEMQKVCAIGIKVRRWVSFHGLALNVTLDLAPFETIIPCGIQNRGVTSLATALGREVSLGEAKARLLAGFESVFPIKWQ